MSFNQKLTEAVWSEEQAQWDLQVSKSALDRKPEQEIYVSDRSRTLILAPSIETNVIF
jgi:hypothetical protein